MNLVFPSIAEESVAQTRAFSGLYLATIAVFYFALGLALLVALGSALEDNWLPA